MVKGELAEKTARLRKGQKRQKKRMATVAAVFFQTPEPRTPEEVVPSLFAPAEPAWKIARGQERSRPHDKRIRASLAAGKTAFITGARGEMLRRDPDRQLARVIVTDRERALQKRGGALFEDVTLVLDLLHVLEKLWKAAHALHSEGSPEAQSFVRDPDKDVQDRISDELARVVTVFGADVERYGELVSQLETRERWKRQRERFLNMGHAVQDAVERALRAIPLDVRIVDCGFDFEVSYSDVGEGSYQFSMESVLVEVKATTTDRGRMTPQAGIDSGKPRRPLCPVCCKPAWASRGAVGPTLVE